MPPTREQIDIAQNLELQIYFLLTLHEDMFMVYWYVCMMNQDSCYRVEIEIPVNNMRKLENSGKSLIHLMSNVNV